jgi:hypothetical protein
MPYDFNHTAYPIPASACCDLQPEPPLAEMGNGEECSVHEFNHTVRALSV